MGRPTKELDERYVEIIRENSEKMSITDTYNKCVDQGMEIKFSTFRKFVRSIAVLDMYRDGKSPEKIVETLKAKGKHNRMTVESVRKMLEIDANEVEDYDKNITEIVEETVVDVEEKPEVVEEAPVKPVEEVESIKDLVSKMVRWGKNDKESIRNITEIDIYKVMLLSQPDDSVVYIPFEVLKQIRYAIEHIVDRNMDMTKFVAICTMRVDKVDIITLGTFDETSHMVRLQIVKSSRPQSDKIYDIQHIKENYLRITLRVNPERI